MSLPKVEVLPHLIHAGGELFVFYCVGDLVELVVGGAVHFLRCLLKFCAQLFGVSGDSRLAAGEFFGGFAFDILCDLILGMGEFFEFLVECVEGLLLLNAPEKGECAIDAFAEFFALHLKLFEGVTHHVWIGTFDGFVQFLHDVFEFWRADLREQ